MSTSWSPRLMKSVPSPRSRVQATRRCGADSGGAASGPAPAGGASGEAAAGSSPVLAAAPAGPPAGCPSGAGSGAPGALRVSEQPASAARTQAAGVSLRFASLRFASLRFASPRSVIRNAWERPPPGRVGGGPRFIVACPVPFPAAAR